MKIYRRTLLRAAPNELTCKERVKNVFFTRNLHTLVILGRRNTAALQVVEALARKHIEFRLPVNVLAYKIKRFATRSRRFLGTGTGLESNRAGTLHDRIGAVKHFAGSFRGDESCRRSIQLMDCLDGVFSNSNPQNDCVVFYEKLKEAVLLQVKKNSGLVGFNTLMLFLENQGLKKNSPYGNKYLIEIHDMLVDYAEEHFLEMFEKIRKYRTFKMPDNMTVDIKNKLLILRGRTIFKDYEQVLQLK